MAYLSMKKETFIEMYIVEWTDKTEIRLEEQSEKMENCSESLQNKM